MLRRPRPRVPRHRELTEEELEQRELDRETKRKEMRLRVQQKVDLMYHIPLRDAAETLRAAAQYGADEEETLRALMVVESFAYSDDEAARQLILLAGVIRPLVALLCDGGGDSNGSEKVSNAARSVTSFVLSRRTDLRDAVVCCVDPSLVCKLLRSGSEKRTMGLEILESAARYFPVQRNEMLAAGVAYAMMIPTGAAEHSEEDIPDELQDTIEITVYTSRILERITCVPPTPTQARAALPDLIKCARYTLIEEDVLLLVRGLITAGTTAHIQAAIDSGTAAVVIDRLRNKDRYTDEVKAACEILRVLASGNASQRAVLLDGGVVGALCDTNHIFDCDIRVLRQSMQYFGKLGSRDSEDYAPRAALLRDRLIPELLDVVASAKEEENRPPYVALLWLSQVACADSAAIDVMRSVGVIQAMTKFLTTSGNSKTSYLRDAALKVLGELCSVHPPTTDSMARTALSELARLSASNCKGTRMKVMQYAADLLERPKALNAVFVSGGQSSGARVQAVIDTKIMRIAVASLNAKNGEEANNAARILTYVSRGNPHQLRCLLEAGALSALMLAAGKTQGEGKNYIAIAGAQLVAAAAAHCRTNDESRQSTLLETHVVRSLLAALKEGQTQSRAPQNGSSKKHTHSCLGGVRVLRSFVKVNSHCREVVLRRDVLSAVACVAKHHKLEEHVRKEASEMLELLCKGPPPPSVPLALAMVPLLAPLCKNETKSVSRAALAALHALTTVVPSAANGKLREDGLPLPARRKTKK